MQVFLALIVWFQTIRTILVIAASQVNILQNGFSAQCAATGANTVVCGVDFDLAVWPAWRYTRKRDVLNLLNEFKIQI